MSIYMKFFIFALLSFVTAFVISRIGNRIGLDDNPTERSSHKKITPKGGGLGILLVFIISSIYLNLNLSFSIPIIFISVLSLYGDKVDLSPLMRLLFQFLSAFIIIYGFKFHPNNIVNYLLIVFFIIFIAGTANFYNFMDGIDGIAGITRAIAFLSLFFYLDFFYPQNEFKELSLYLSAGCIGFLPLNFPKAKVFMGDVGSILLGFAFGSLIIICSKNIIDFLCMSGFLFTFYCDEILTMIVRIKNRDSLGKPHRKHLYQLLVNELNYKHYKISLLYGTIQFLISISILFLRNKSVLMILTFYIISSILFISFYYIIRRKVAAGYPI